MKNWIKKNNKILSFILLVTFLFGLFCFPSQESIAASKKATLDNLSLDISCGSLMPDTKIFIPNKKYCISVNNAVKKATYSFTSSNPKVLKIKASGAKCYLTGIRPGSAVITCKQKLNNKVTKVGTCKVTVNKASVKLCNDTLCMGTDITYNKYDSICEIVNRNTDATYTYNTNSKNLSMTEVTSNQSGDNKGAYIYVQKYTADKAGTYTVTVNETVGKTTKKIGDFQVKVMEPVFTEILTFDTGELFSGDQVVQYPINSNYGYYSVEGDGFDLLDINSVVTYKENSSGTHSLCANKAGKAKLNIFEVVDKKLVATVDVVVKDANCTKIDVDMHKEYYMEEGRTEINVQKRPETAVEELIVKSSDTKIAEIEHNAIAQKFYIIPVSKGEVTISFRCGDIEHEETIKICTYDDDIDNGPIENKK